VFTARYAQCPDITQIRFVFKRLTLCLLMSDMYTYGATCKARNFNVVYIYIDYIYGPTFGNSESHLFLFAAQCFNTETKTN
jgi:hypothetical protein